MQIVGKLFRTSIGQSNLILEFYKVHLRHRTKGQDLSKNMTYLYLISDRKSQIVSFLKEENKKLKPKSIRIKLQRIIGIKNVNKTFKNPIPVDSV
ncbi:hypothetical protein TTHERM_000400729 (macronuclear) [Tetrahymena thermophila SB210]|uniref:Uncharacterized protein n=1 Tax=Tetrahymena thermophila (strain SB210) TaxID=312017 RepID=W7XBP0_TETTS|nr:hypothetical protein TTHERM_000400729 [Tetrahymena thermophila SB210]EWS74777.1 hypothetical protein TTHERM_000400729 [Tetrahymena thermophila SB210]|eukprot:XP_012652670.1 hypothetical protein TTHERM_000400729 [Tetrahymena thermophila SB210]